MPTDHVPATPTQIATGLPVTIDTCPVCDRPLRSGTPVTVRLGRTQDAAQPVWEIQEVRCRECPRPPASPPAARQLLAATLGLCSHAHTQTHTLCLTDCEPLADHTAVDSV